VLCQDLRDAVTHALVLVDGGIEEQLGAGDPSKTIQIARKNLEFVAGPNECKGTEWPSLDVLPAGACPSTEADLSKGDHAQDVFGKGAASGALLPAHLQGPEAKEWLASAVRRLVDSKGCGQQELAYLLDLGDVDSIWGETTPLSLEAYHVGMMLDELSFVPADRICMVQGCKSRADLNGCFVKLVGPCPDGQTHSSVSVFQSGEELQLHRKNMRLFPLPGPFLELGLVPNGAPCLVDGSNSRADLNGKRAVVLEDCAEEQTHVWICVEGEEELQMHRKNLQICEPRLGPESHKQMLSHGHTAQSSLFLGSRSVEPCPEGHTHAEVCSFQDGEEVNMHRKNLRLLPSLAPLLELALVPEGTRCLVEGSNSRVDLNGRQATVLEDCVKDQTHVRILVEGNGKLQMHRKNLLVQEPGQETPQLPTSSQDSQLIFTGSASLPTIPESDTSCTGEDAEVGKVLSNPGERQQDSAVRPLSAAVPDPLTGASREDKLPEGPPAATGTGGPREGAFGFWSFLFCGPSSVRSCAPCCRVRTEEVFVAQAIDAPSYAGGASDDDIVHLSLTPVVDSAPPAGSAGEPPTIFDSSPKASAIEGAHDAPLVNVAEADTSAGPALNVAVCAATQVSAASARIKEVSPLPSPRATAVAASRSAPPPSLLLTPPPLPGAVSEKPGVARKGFAGAFGRLMVAACGRGRVGAELSTKASLDLSAAPPQHPPTRLHVSLAEQLREMAQLKAEGVLTEEEFIAAKAKILAPGY